MVVIVVMASIAIVGSLYRVVTYAERGVHSYKRIRYITM